MLEKLDVIRWAKWLRQQGCQKIYGLGESLGAAVLIQAALMTKFDAIVAECAYSDLPSIARERTVQMLSTQDFVPAFSRPLLASGIVETSLVYARLRYGIWLGSASPRDAIAHTDTPILLIHGLDDDRTRSWHSRALAQASSSARLWLVPGAGHTGAATAAGKEFRDRVLGWFKQH